MLPSEMFRTTLKHKTMISTVEVLPDVFLVMICHCSLPLAAAPIDHRHRQTPQPIHTTVVVPAMYYCHIKTVVVRESLSNWYIPQGGVT